jgi:hypothetical protein
MPGLQGTSEMVGVVEETTHDALGCADQAALENSTLRVQQADPGLDRLRGEARRVFALHRPYRLLSKEWVPDT